MTVTAGFEQSSNRSPIDRRSSVLAVIPHFKYEKWLPYAIESMLAQTRPPDGIVVIDDASEPPPVEIVQQFPQVTLMVTAENVGIFRILQAVVDHADYDALLIQDADDWSTPERLALLLEEAERTGAELVGSQVEQVFEDAAPQPMVMYPQDVNAIVIKLPYTNFHPLILGSALVGRDLVRRIGGFASGLRMNADSEFIRRSVFATKVRNIRQRCYFYRRHNASLTRHPTTGDASPERAEVRRKLHEQAQENVKKVLNGKQPNLHPMAVAPSIELTHVTGPKLRWA